MTSLIFVKAKIEEKHNKIVILSFAQLKTNFVHFGGLKKFQKLILISNFSLVTII